jgi:hypothetical protein
VYALAGWVEGRVDEVLEHRSSYDARRETAASA